MVVILVLLTFFAFIAFEVIRERRARQAEARATYFHPGHAWARIMEDDIVTVGVDDFTQKLMGEVDAVQIPQAGKVLRQGEVVWELKHAERALPQVSPISGTVVQVNQKLQSNPSLVNSSPYQEGWLLKVKAAALKEDLKNLFSSGAVKKWMESVKVRLASHFAQEIGPVYQDGGELVSGIGNKLNDEKWEAIVHEFFLPNRDKQLG